MTGPAHDDLLQWRELERLAALAERQVAQLQRTSAEGAAAALDAAAARKRADDFFHAMVLSNRVAIARRFTRR